MHFFVATCNACPPWQSHNPVRITRSLITGKSFIGLWVCSSLWCTRGPCNSRATSFWNHFARNKSLYGCVLGVRQCRHVALRHGAFCVSRQLRLCRRWRERIFMFYSWKIDVFIHRLWNNVYDRWITSNFPCKWHRTASTASGCESSPIKIQRRRDQRRQPRSRENVG